MNKIQQCRNKTSKSQDKHFSFTKIKILESTIRPITHNTGDDQISVLQWTHDIKTSYHSTTINSKKGGL